MEFNERQLSDILNTLQSLDRAIRGADGEIGILARMILLESNVKTFETTMDEFKQLKKVIYSIEKKLDSHLDYHSHIDKGYGSFEQFRKRWSDNTNSVIVAVVTAVIVAITMSLIDIFVVH